MVKKVMNKGIEMDIQAGLELESDHFGLLCKTEDKNEGANAFLEKRAPQFSGR
jgi:enoyl-CoA hydratase/carnithine racemase